jgi:hypothetical protein
VAEILYAPSPERVVATNAWAFLYWLRMVRRISLVGWDALLVWSAQEPATFDDAIRTFAGQSPVPSALSRKAPGRAWGVADYLLFADLRPDDRLVVMEGEGTDPFGRTGDEGGSVLIAPAQALAGSAFQRPNRPNLANLRTIIATGGPMSPEQRRRIYTWVKADVMLLACAGNRYWGNPLEPVLARPSPAPAFLTPRPSARPPL